MVRPTLLMTFDGTLTGQSSSGPVTATAIGPVNYEDGLVSGGQAYVPQQSTGSYLTIAGSYISISGGELVLRVRPTSTFDSNSQYFIANTGYPSGTNNRIFLRRAQATGIVQGSFGSLDNITSPSALTNDVYHTISLRWGGDAASLYINNPTTPVRSITATALSAPSTGLLIGRSPSGNNQYTNGRLDDLAIYPRGLTDDERAVLFDVNTAWAWNTLAADSPRTILTPDSRPITILTPH